MLRLYMKLRFVQRNPIQSIYLLNEKFYSKQSSSSSSSSSSSDSSSDDEAKPKKLAPSKSVAAKQKLNDLLKKMVEEKVENSKNQLDLAKPKPKRNVRNEKGVKSVKKETVEEKVVTAVKEVAKNIGGDVKQTESELLSKLLNIPKEGEKDTKMQLSLSDIIKDMKVDHSAKASSTATRAQQVKQLLNNVQNTGRISRPSGSDRPRAPRKPMGQRGQIEYENIDLFGHPPLGIFTKEDTPQESEQIVNKTWDELYERDLRLVITHPPSNYFQEMILWTEQGKIWKFPIDNEQGLEAEKEVYFADHIFLEQHLEGWCPEKGPVRHYMELVCVGLSKNPYLTVEKKVEHIQWYKNYFEEKKQLLKEVGAIPVDSSQDKKQIE